MCPASEGGSDVTRPRRACGLETVQTRMWACAQEQGAMGEQPAGRAVRGAICPEPGVPALPRRPGLTVQRCAFAGGDQVYFLPNRHRSAANAGLPPSLLEPQCLLSLGARISVATPFAGAPGVLLHGLGGKWRQEGPFRHIASPRTVSRGSETSRAARG